MRILPCPRSQNIDRRRFLAGGLGAVGGVSLLSSGPFALARMLDRDREPGRAPPRSLVVLRLTGGNDGLSTVIPWADDTYHRLRPSIRHEPDAVLRLDEYRGLHPGLRELRARFDDGEVAIVEGVGYPGSDRTHFQSRRVWHAGRLGAGPRPTTSRESALETAAAMSDEGRDPRVVSSELGGFDTHNDQRRRHDALMRTLDESLSTLRDVSSGVAGERETTVLVFSELGRRLAENHSRGTDHGLAGPVFVIGSRVRGGLYGEHPSLEELDHGAPRPTTDFRSVYATLIESLFAVEHERVLGDTCPLLDFLTARERRSPSGGM